MLGPAAIDRRAVGRAAGFDVLHTRGDRRGGGGAPDVLAAAIDRGGGSGAVVDLSAACIQRRAGGQANQASRVVDALLAAAVDGRVDHGPKNALHAAIADRRVARRAIDGLVAGKIHHRIGRKAGRRQSCVIRHLNAYSLAVVGLLQQVGSAGRAADVAPVAIEEQHLPLIAGDAFIGGGGEGLPFLGGATDRNHQGGRRQLERRATVEGSSAVRCSEQVSGGVQEQSGLGTGPVAAGETDNRRGHAGIAGGGLGNLEYLAGGSVWIASLNRRAPQIASLVDDQTGQGSIHVGDKRRGYVGIAGGGLGNLEHRACVVYASRTRRAEQIARGVHDQLASGVSPIGALELDQEGRSAGVAVRRLGDLKHGAFATRAELCVWSAVFCRAEQVPRGIHDQAVSGVIGDVGLVGGKTSQHCRAGIASAGLGKLVYSALINWASLSRRAEQVPGGVGDHSANGICPIAAVEVDQGGRRTGITGSGLGDFKRRAHAVCTAAEVVPIRFPAASSVRLSTPLAPELKLTNTVGALA